MIASKNNISICLIGLGRIGAGIFQNKLFKNSETHLKNILHNKFKLIALVDVDINKINIIKKKIDSFKNIIFYQKIDDILNVSDVFVLATPPKDRLGEISKLLKFNPKLIIIEKPLALDFSTAKKIHNMLLKSKSRTKVIINFHRRFDTDFIKLKNSLKSYPKKIIMTYGKGLFNYGTHLIDILIYLFGQIKSVSSNDIKKSKNPSFTIQMKKEFEVQVIGLNDLEYDQFEIEFYFSNKKVSFLYGGAKKFVQIPKENLYFQNYNHLMKPESFSKNNLQDGMSNLYINIKDYIYNNKEINGCSIKEAMHGISVLDAVKESFRYKKNKKPKYKFNESIIND